jgi:putative transposase
MPRRSRVGTAGLIFHVINRGAKKTRLFDCSADYAAFENLLFATRERVQIPLLTYCLMPNHWHLVLWPERDGDLSTFMQLLTFVHAQRWNQHRALCGAGAVYQGRFKAIAVQNDAHFLRLCRYVEANPIRAGLVDDPLEWRWSSFWRREHHCADQFLNPWPSHVPKDWAARLRASAPDDEVITIRNAIIKNVALGTEAWTIDTAARLGRSIRARGRPKIGGA